MCSFMHLQCRWLGKALAALLTCTTVSSRHFYFIPLDNLGQLRGRFTLISCILMVLFQRQSTVPYKILKQNEIKGTFFWDYSGMRILGKDDIRVPLEAIPFILLPRAEWTEWTEYGLLGIPRICVLLGNFWREIQCGCPRQSPGFRLEGVVVPMSPPPWVFRFTTNEGSFGNWNSVYSVIPKLE